MANEKLVKFLYLLLRDHATSGQVHSLMAWVNESQINHKHIQYSCQYTEGLAREIASELMELPQGQEWGVFYDEPEEMKPLNYEGDDSWQ